MKRKTALLTALVLLLTAACAFAETGADLYDVYGQTEAGRVWAGNAVPIIEGVQIMSPAGLIGEYDSLEVWNGTEYRAVMVALYTAQGKILVLVDEESDREGSPSYDLAESAETVWTGDLLVRSGDRMGSRINRAVYDAAGITWQDMDCILLTLSGDTVLGSPLLTKDGKLAGIIAAEYAEGENRYIALTASEIGRCMIEAADLLGGEDMPPAGYTVTLDKNVAVFDWTEVYIPEIPEGQSLFHVVADLDCDYLTYLELEPGEENAKCEMILTPGRRYVSGLMICPAGSLPDDLPEQYALTEVPEAEKLTEHSFRSEVFAIGDLALNARTDEMPAPAEEITEEFLRSGRACIWSVTSYDVEADISNLSLLVSLTAPDGNNYRWESAWIYSPSYEERDEWYVRMDDSGLLEMLDAAGYPDGAYEMCMYIDGKLADSFTFTLGK